MCSRYQSTPTEELWQVLKRILRYIKGTIDYELFYPKQESEQLVGYADADWAADIDDRKSTTGFLFKVCGATVSWCIRKQSVVAISSTEAEYIALAEAAREGLWLLHLIKDFGFDDTAFKIFEDNESCIRLADHSEHKILKHIDVKYNFIRELVQNKIIKIEYVCTTEQIADILTKSLDKSQFNKLSLKLGLTNVNVKTALLGKYQTSINYKLLKAPEINPEILPVLADIQIKKDKYQRLAHSQLGVGLTSLGEALTLLLKQSGSQNEELLKLLIDSGKILIDIFFNMSRSRRAKSKNDKISVASSFGSAGTIESQSDQIYSHKETWKSKHVNKRASYFRGTHLKKQLFADKLNTIQEVSEVPEIIDVDKVPT
ncbi:Copia protein-like Protein [Tribolium castaneum]|uniref:Copia protein-like Protein n=1 Tax=Tribolium castaneum TaxID=7070 RepID=D7ELB0_TRICA|nr:Copia protein-like Protein [Tribolium castaneum]